MVGFKSLQAVRRPLLFEGWSCIAREGAGVGLGDAQNEIIRYRLKEPAIEVTYAL